MVISRRRLIELSETYKVDGMTTSEVDISDSVHEQLAGCGLDEVVSICSLATATH